VHVKNIVGKPEGQRSILKRKCTLENNIKMEVREIRYNEVDMIQLAQDSFQWRINSEYSDGFSGSIKPTNFRPA
jgi:hypothetical protein